MADIISPGHSFSAQAYGAIEKYDTVVNHTTEGMVLKSAGDNAEAVGCVHTDSAATLEGITVFVSGVVYCRAAAAITVNTPVMSAADGEIKDCAAVADTTYYIVGYAMGAAAAADEICPILIQLHRFSTESA